MYITWEGCDHQKNLSNKARENISSGVVLGYIEWEWPKDESRHCKESEAGDLNLKREESGDLIGKADVWQHMFRL